MTTASLPRKRLGRTGLDVTALGHGAMEVRGPRVWRGRPITDSEASQALNGVLDAGINFIDTSYDYGMSEDFIGRFLSSRRGEYFLATKCGCHFENKGDHDDTPHIWTRDNLLHNIETSLRRMKTDHVDLWQLHNPTVAAVEGGDLVKVLEEVKKSGKTRWIGISSTFPDLTTFLSWGVFDAFQIPYSALERKHEKVISDVAKAGAGTIIRGGVARGAPGDAGLGKEERWQIWDKAKLAELCEPGESRTTFLLRFTLSHPDLHTTIVGTINPGHLADNVKTARKGPLAPKVYEEAKRRLAAAGEKP